MATAGTSRPFLLRWIGSFAVFALLLGVMAAVLAVRILDGRNDGAPAVPPLPVVDDTGTSIAPALGIG